MSEEFSYDAVPYPSKFFLQTHPDRLATAAMLYGMRSAQAQKCRVLELGCGNGSNLISHAFGLPDSEFVGIDLSEKHIEKANASANELGLKNITFQKMDVLEITVDDFGRFDFITAHGLFSWVPDFVRDKVLSLFSELLTENGVGYISYNAFPGCYAREMVRSIMRFHTRETADPQQKVEAAISYLKFLAENSTEPEVYRPILQAEFKRHLNHSAEDIYHDDLGECYRPFFFHEFASLLSANGMQFLSEAELHASSMQGLSEHAVESLNNIQDVIEREQHLDLLRGRVFRQTLFCRDSVVLDRDPQPEVLEKLFLSSTLKPVGEVDDISASKVEKFISAKGQQMQIDHPLTKAALLHLGEIWGRSIGTAELLEEAKEIVERSGGTSDDWDNEFGIARSVLLQICLGSDMIEVHSYAPDAGNRAGTRPMVNRLSVWQLRDADNVLTLLNKDLKLNDTTAHHLLEIMDGTRPRMNLSREMQSFVRGQKDIENKQQLITEMDDWIEESIAELERLGVFEA
jgi:SAM-dependent methyltransferase